MSRISSKSDTCCDFHQRFSKKRFMMKAIAVFIVAVFMMSSVAIAAQMNMQDAGGVKINGYKDIPMGPDYGYKIHYDENNTGITKVEASTNNGDFKDVSRVTTDKGYSMNSFWSFNDKGLGPFNVFYAAINITTQEYIDDGCSEDRLSHYAGSIAYVLAPNNLDTTINGNHFDSSLYNIVLVIPTVYWYSDPATKTLYMSNVKDYFDSSAINSNLQAYAHTFYDKGVEKTTAYIGLGVYLSSLVSESDIGVSSLENYQYLVSQPGREPANNYKVNEYNKMTQNLESLGGDQLLADYQQWNYYQWTLYKMMSYSILGTKNAQKMLGNGYWNPNVSGVYAGTAYEGNPTAFPYRGGSDSTVSLLIQNPYGASKWEYIGNSYVSTDKKLHVGNDLNPGDLGTSAHESVYDISNITANGWISEASKESAWWDLPTAFVDKETETIDTIHDRVGRPTGYFNAVLANGDAWQQGGIANVVFDSNVNAKHLIQKSRMVVIFKTGDVDITFKPGDASGEEYKQTFQVGMVQNLEKCKFTAPTGMEFAGWAYEGSSGTQIVQDEARIAIATPQTFTATWAQNVFTVSFDTNGGTSTASQKVAKGTCATDPALTQPVSSPTKAGYVLRGWYEDSSCTGTPFDFSTPIAGDKTLYAKWVEAVTVKYDSNGGSRVESIVMAKGDPMQWPETTRTGYDFKGWYSDAAQTVPSPPNVPVNSNMTVYAKWAQLYGTAYTVTFNTGVSGMYIASQTVIEGQTVVPPERPTRADYTFAEWYDSTGQYNFGKPVTKDITLTAHWSEWAYTVKFDSNNGICIASDMQVGVSSGADLPDETKCWRSGYKLVGWNENKDATTGVFHLNAHYKEKDKVVTLYAIWEADSSHEYYTITFDSDGGSPVLPQRISPGGKATVPYPDPTKSEIDFNYWANGSSEFNFDTIIDKDYNLKAVWHQYTYTLVFNANGGNFTSTAKTIISHYHENTYSLSAIESELSRDGYALTGWVDSNGNAVAAGSTVTLSEHSLGTNVELTAQWTKTYTVTFDTAGGTPSYEAQTVVDGGLVKAPTTTPTKTDYTFQGWYVVVAPNKIKYDFSSPVYSDLNIVADWVTTRSLQAEITMYSSKEGVAEVVDTALIGKGDVFPEPKVTVPPVMKFMGWHKITSMKSPTEYTYEKEEFDFTKPVNEDVSIITLVVPNTYVIHFDLNEGSGVMPDIKATSLQHHILLDNSKVTRADYNFDGWELPSQSKAKATTIYTDVIEDPLTTVDGVVITLVAKWSKIHTITFDSMGGTTVQALKVVNGTKATQPENPTRTDYTFKNWYVVGSPDEAFSFNSVITKDLQLAARWDATGMHTVKFMSGLGKVMVVQDVLVGKCAEKPTEKPTRPGYTFSDWCLQGETQPYDFTKPVTTDLVITVLWTENTYTVKFDLNGGSGEPIGDKTVKASESLVLPDSGITREHYIFKGWTKVADGTNPMTGTVPASVLYDGSATQTLYASWEKQKVVTFDPMNGTANIIRYVDPGEKISDVPTPADTEHYKFKLWHLVSSQQAFDFNTRITEDITLYAEWDVVGTVHKVEFYKKLQDGTEVLAGTQKVFEGDKVIPPEDPMVEGMVFLGWFNGEQKFDFNTSIEGDLKLVTKWRPAMYTILFDYNGGTGEMGSITVPVFAQGIVLDNSSVKWEKHRFDSWNTKADGSGKEYIDAIAKPLSNADGDEITLYAQWTIQYQVTFDSNGGSSVPAQLVAAGEMAERPEDPTKYSHEFIGWFSDQGLTTLFNFETKITKDTTIYAGWEYYPIYHSVIYESNGGTEVPSEIVLEGDVLTEPTTTKEGYIFKGWYSNAELTAKYDFSRPVYSDLVLYAKWSLPTHVVSFNTAGGTAIPDQVVDDGGFIVKPQDPVKENYDFKGWFADAEGKVAFDFTAPVYSDLTVYAAWAEHVDPPTPTPEDDELPIIPIAVGSILALLIIVGIWYTYSRTKV